VSTVSQSGVSLLIVVDDEMLRETLAMSFGALGYRVRSASDGFGALHVINEELPDILLSDLQMPGMSGFELLYIVHRRFPAIRVVAMSGAYSGAKVPEGIAAHVFHAKGTNPKTLFQTVGAMAQCERDSLTKISGIPGLIWIARNIHDCSRQPYVLLSCPECLRTFPELLGREAPIHESYCFYCRPLLRYAIVQQANSILPAPTHARLNEIEGSGWKRQRIVVAWRLSANRRVAHRR
jgi:CheY-like chemotaxis protein